MADRERDEFYVGYLGLPAGHRAWLRMSVPAILWGLCAVAAVISLAMRPSGGGVWDTSQTVTIEGNFEASPYPLVRTPDGRSFILVEPGKIPLRSGLESFVGSRVRVEGFELRRDDRRIIELLPGEKGITDVGDSDAEPATLRALGERTLAGEIVDYKCFLGAMKPGDGLTHRACAVLCIQGGIPPALVEKTPTGDRYYLLVDPSGSRANGIVLEHVGVPVEVTGELFEAGGLHYLAIGRDSIR